MAIEVNVRPVPKVTIEAKGIGIASSSVGYDDTELRNRIEAIEAKEAQWDKKSDFSGKYEDLAGAPEALKTHSR